MGTEVFHHLKSVLKSKAMTTSVGDEGGFAPNLNSNEEALEVILEAIEKAGIKPGMDIYLALDVAANELYKNNTYNLYSEGRQLKSEDMVEYLSSLSEQYPISSIEDGLHEDDWAGWNHCNNKLGSKIQIVGDDLTVTNTKRLQRAIDDKSMNAILIKLNQIGTVTETIQTVQLARNAGFGAIISHRSGETEDTIIADLAVAMGHTCQQPPQVHHDDDAARARTPGGSLRPRDDVCWGRPGDRRRIRTRKVGPCACAGST
mgnify:CR=1 FL=1